MPLKSGNRGPNCPGSVRKSYTSSGLRRTWNSPPNLIAMRLAPHGRRRGIDGPENVLVASTAAGIACDGFANLLFIGMGVTREELQSREHQAGSAITALQPVAVNECLLNGVQLTIALKPLDGSDFRAIGLNGKHRARFHGITAQEHGARTAIRRVAANVRAGEFQVFAPESNEQFARLHFTRDPVAIYRGMDGNCRGIRH